MLRTIRRMPFFKVLAIGQAALLARRHFMRLNRADRRRLAQLLRRGHRLDKREREELIALVGKLEPRAFAVAATDALSPVRLPRRLSRAASGST